MRHKIEGRFLVVEIDDDEKDEIIKRRDLNEDKSYPEPTMI